MLLSDSSDGFLVNGCFSERGCQRPPKAGRTPLEGVGGLYEMGLSIECGRGLPAGSIGCIGTGLCRARSFRCRQTVAVPFFFSI